MMRQQLRHRAPPHLLTEASRIIASSDCPRSLSAARICDDVPPEVILENRGNEGNSDSLPPSAAAQEVLYVLHWLDAAGLSSRGAFPQLAKGGSDGPRDKADR